MAASSEDFSGVKVIFDKPGGYTTGDVIKATLTGKGVVVLPQRPLTVTFPVIDPTSGNTGSVTGTVPFTEVDQNSVKGNGAPTDDAGLGHVYTLSPDGLSATATA